MRLLYYNGGDLSFAEFFKSAIPKYAILSHTWEGEEVTFEDLQNGTGKKKDGYKKIRFCAEQAKRDGLQYFWVDTCCIDKSNPAELVEAINSMFRWYRMSTKCYVYLSDMSRTAVNIDELAWESAFRKSRWFTRGWTLQELIAPISVEFFCREAKRIGSKSTLEQQIHEITGIPKSALQGAYLSQFTDKERFSWIQPRQTTVEEDKAYSLLGIFDVQMPLRYGEGTANAFKRLEEEIDKFNKCLQDLRLSDPRDDKTRIEDTKGGLLQGSYNWVLETSDFQQWRDDQQSRLLWIKGDPGKGKTMLLCGIINELEKSMPKTDILSYFFCQATDSRINHATAVLRGLLYLLINQQPSLISHIQKKHDHAGKTLFKDTNAWFAMSEIFTSILQDPSLRSTFLIIDALDECTADLPRLLNLIVHISSICPRVKWVVASRNWPSIEKNLDTATQKKRLCLELNEESVSAAVIAFIKCKVDWLAARNEYECDTRDRIQQYLSLNANGTFLWVALVCQELADIPGWDAEEKAKAFPPGLGLLYQRMFVEIQSSPYSELCTRILAVVSTVYRPVTLDELASFVDMPRSGNHKVLSNIIGLCGSFLTLRERTISFVHQSAKDFLVEKARNKIYPYGVGDIHHTVFSRSLQIMSMTLRRDVYRLGSLGISIDEAKRPDPDPLSAARYSCLYWIDHLLDCDPAMNATKDIQDGGSVDIFLRRSYLYWLEALSLCRSMSKGVASMAKLEALSQVSLVWPLYTTHADIRQAIADASRFLEVVQDARRFIMYHKAVLENSPLQAYMSALVFSPANSLIRNTFKHEEPKWITIQPAMRDEWSACLQTLEGHTDDYFNSVAFSHDSTRLVLASDNVVKIWDISSGECLQMLKGRSRILSMILHDPKRLVTASTGGAVQIWDIASGECLQTLQAPINGVVLADSSTLIALSHDLTHLAFGSRGGMIVIWDVASAKVLHMLHLLNTIEGLDDDCISSISFSYNSSFLASASYDGTVNIWDVSNGKCLRKLGGPGDDVAAIPFSVESLHTVTAFDESMIGMINKGSQHASEQHEGTSSITFSHDSTKLALGSYNGVIKIWDAIRYEYLHIFEGHSDSIISFAFSHNSTRLASASEDMTIKVWDMISGKCQQTFEGHSRSVQSVAFSHDSTRLASASMDMTVKIWDVNSGKGQQMLESQGRRVRSVAFSPDSSLLASGSEDGIVKIWDVSTGDCKETLEGHTYEVNSVVFSQHSLLLASSSGKEVKIWDIVRRECRVTITSLYGFGFESATFSHDSTRLASAETDATVKIWDVCNGTHLQTLIGHSSVVFSAAFSWDSARVTSASIGTIKVWDITNSECQQTLYHSNVRSVAFSHDCIRVASASRDTVKIWDASSGACLQTLNVGKTLETISFDSTGLFIHTNIGTIALHKQSARHVRRGESESHNAHFQGIALGSSGVWLTLNSEHLLWLPTDYRSSCSAVSGNTVCVGSNSRNIWIYKVQLSNSGA